MTSSLERHLHHQTEGSDRFFWHRLRWFALSRYFPQDQSFQLVDIGAGAGFLGSYLARDFPLASYRFVEPIESLNHHLIERYGDDADATADNDYRSAHFVTAMDVLEHQLDDHAFMRALVGRMRPGATLLLTVPALTHLWSQWDVVLEHCRRYDRGDLLHCFRDLPLAVREVSFLFPELVPPAMLRARLGSPKEPDTGITLGTFPSLPRVADDLLFLLGRPSVSLRRHWRTGTSLFAVVTVSGLPPV
jgi:hypothetical protein